MIRRKKLIKNTALTLAIISVFGSTLSSVSAAELSENITPISQYVDNEYDITSNTKLLKDNSTSTSMANQYLSSSKLIVNNGKLKLQITFKEGDIVTSILPKISDKEVAFDTVYNESTKLRSVTFDISSLEDNIKLDCTMFGTVNATCVVDIDSENIDIPTTEDKDDALTSPTPEVPNGGDENDKEETDNGTVINASLKHESQDKDSSANKYLKSTKIVEENNSKYMVMTFDNADGLLVELIGMQNDEKIETSNVFNDDEKTLTIKFKISSLDNLKLSFTYNNPLFGQHTVLARISTDSNSNEDITPPSTDDTTNENDSSGSTDSNSGNTSGTTDTYKNGYYQLKNVLHLDNQVGYAMVRNLLSETTNMEVKDGKMYMTLKMSSYSLMSNINIKVNNKNANFTKTSVGNDSVEFRVEVPSADAKLTFSMFVSAMGKSVDFDLSFDKSTVKFISSNEEPSIPNTGGNTNDSNSSTESNTGESNNTTENTVVKGKLYTIQNQVISSSETGKQMARKYLNSTTKIEEVNGQMYATLTFTGVDLMSNHKIYVNGSVVSHTVTSKTSSSISIRFAIPNVNADIKVQAYIIPMSSTVTFGVKLLEDTLTFVKDFDVENGTLPQTGSAITTGMMISTGGLLTVAGVLLNRKRK